MITFTGSFHFFKDINTTAITVSPAVKQTKSKEASVLVAVSTMTSCFGNQINLFALITALCWNHNGIFNDSKLTQLNICKRADGNFPSFQQWHELVGSLVETSIRRFDGINRSRIFFSRYSL
jgi:hypothetical protein